MSRNVKIYDIATLNKETYKKSDLPAFLNYLDTGNLTKNKVDNYLYLNTERDKIPSRAQRKIKKGTILYSTVRPNQEHYGFYEGKIENIVVSTGFTTIDIIDKYVSSKFIYFLLTQNHITDYLHTIGMNSVSSYPSISPTDIGNLSFKIPNLQTQKQIAKVLSDLDAKIEINNKINQELEAMAKTLYDYWFVQFDFPVVTSSGVEKPYKSNGGKMVFNAELKREIPEGWKVSSLIKFCNKIGDGIHGTPEYVDESEFRFINGNNLKNGFIRTDNETKKVSSEEYNKYFIELNDDSILLSINGTLGNLAVYTGEKVMLGKSSAYINCKEGYKAYCYQFLNQNHMQQVFWNTATGSTIKNLSLDSIKKLKILSPNNNLIKQFEINTSSADNKRENIFKENKKLTQLRDWLLPMLMNGQVTVTEAEEQLGLVAEDGLVYKKEKVIKLSISQELEEKHFLKRKILASYIINQSLNDSQFGDVKFEKLLHLADYYVIQRNLGQKYFQKAAGPYDNTFTYAYFQQVLKAKWYYKEKLGNLNRIKADVNQSKSINTYGHFSQEELNQVNELINKFKNLNYEVPEIISTLYAVWNNRMLKKQTITDELLKEDFLNWDKQKVKYIDRIQGALTWMRENEIIPNGWGNVIEKAKSK